MSDDRWDKENNPQHSPKRAAKRYIPSRWQSRQAPGTPAGFEAIFILMKNNQMESVAFQYAKQNVHSDLKEEELWHCYESWVLGQIHPLIQAWIAIKK